MMSSLVDRLVPDLVGMFLFKPGFSEMVSRTRTGHTWQNPYRDFCKFTITYNHLPMNQTHLIMFSALCLPHPHWIVFGLRLHPPSIHQSTKVDQPFPISVYLYLSRQKHDCFSWSLYYPNGKKKSCEEMPSTMSFW